MSYADKNQLLPCNQFTPPAEGEGGNGADAGLRKELGSFWKYRLGDHRVVAEIIDHRVVIIVVRVGHRREMHRK